MKNLNMMAKLAVGFGAVLVLMLTISAANLYGLSEITERGETLDVIYEMEDAAVELIQVGDDYLIVVAASMDPATARRVTEVGSACGVIEVDSARWVAQRAEWRVSPYTTSAYSSRSCLAALTMCSN